MNLAPIMSASSKVRLAAMLVTAGMAFLAPAAAHAQAADPGMMRGNEPRARQAIPQQQEKQFPVGVPWSAIDLNGKPYPPGQNRPYFTIDTQFRLRGFGGCNTFSATAYPLRNQGFAVSPFAVTKRSCGSAVDAAERAFLLALRMSQKWDLVKGQLVLQGPAGTLRGDRAL